MTMQLCHGFNLPPNTRLSGTRLRFGHYGIQLRASTFSPPLFPIFVPDTTKRRHTSSQFSELSTVLEQLQAILLSFSQFLIDTIFRKGMSTLKNCCKVIVIASLPQDSKHDLEGHSRAAPSSGNRVQLAVTAAK